MPQATELICIQYHFGYAHGELTYHDGIINKLNVVGENKNNVYNSIVCR